LITERQSRELVARCVSVMACYHDEARRPHALARMTAHIRAIAEEAEGLALGDRAAVARLVRPVEDALYARYGHEVGRRISGPFSEAFEGTAPRPMHGAVVGIGTPPGPVFEVSHVPA